MNTNISEKLKAIREATGWSETKIGEEIGKSQPTAHRILNGQGDCNGSTLRAIEDLHARICIPTPK
jgi:transcriptional regulator with XRE-family HTH domain